MKPFPRLRMPLGRALGRRRTPTRTVTAPQVLERKDDKNHTPRHYTARIAYLVSRYPAVSHTFILREVLALRALGYEIHVASINPPDRATTEMTQAEQAESAQTYIVKRTPFADIVKAHWQTLLSHPRAYLQGLWTALTLGGLDLKKLLYHCFYFIEAVLVGRWMMERQLRHLHVHFATPAATVGLIASRVFPLTFSMTVHGPDEFYDVSAYRLAEKVAGASFVCCIGAYARSQLLNFTQPHEWEKIVVAPLGIDPSVFTPRPFRSHPAPCELLCVGRLVSVKGQRVLIAACEHLIDAGYDIRLRFVGAGPDLATLTAEVQTRGLSTHIEFAGAVNQDHIRGFYEAADIFVLPSFAEGIPVVLMEAMAMEIPCVTTWITGIPELIRSGRDGLLVPPGDEEALAEALRQLIDDPALRRRIGRAGRQQVIEKYDLRRNTLRLAEIFQRRVGGEA
jgi:colanic acid/amylovoran biosynthesis glycosyltransferase